MKFLKSIFILFALLLVCKYGNAQSTPATLAVLHEDENEANTTVNLRTKLPRLVNDTNGVNLLLKLTHVYWHTRTSQNNNIDSCLMYAKNALDISRKLRFVNGSNEAAFIMCKAYTAQNNVTPALALSKQFYGEMQAKLLLSIAEHYVFDFEAGTQDFLRSLPLIEQAVRVSQTVKSTRWWDECQVLQGKYYFKTGDVESGRKAFMKIAEAAHVAKQYDREAMAWSTMGIRLPDSDSTSNLITQCHEQAVKYYLLAGNKKEAAYSLRDLATINGNYNKADSAENQLLRCISLLKSINEPVSLMTYTILADFYRMNGKYDKALYYAFIALKTPEKIESKKFNTHVVLGRVYDLLKMYPQSLHYYRLAFEFAKDRKTDLKYTLANDIAYLEAAIGNPKKGIAFLLEFMKSHPTPLINVKQITAGILGDIYKQMKDYRNAERYYLEMLSYNDAARIENQKNLDYVQSTISGTGAYFKAGKFYIERSDFAKGKNLLNKSLESHQYLDTDQVFETELLLFRADSALGNYVSAIRHFKKHKLMSDSINSVAKNKQISELNIRYETEQRLKDIKTLQNKQLMQQVALQHSEWVRNIILAGAVMLLLLLAIAYNAYRNKQRSNIQLTQQREKIDSQNQALQVLLNEKDQFIKEKDWLLKEVHHRVKNNLQIVMSLLSSQSAFLQNDDAIEAITQSENRVQSIALIHQKLYTSDNMASINIAEYISELVVHLADSFNTTKRNIIFNKQIAPIGIDLSQSLPIGLILNEAITNAIKYAFDEKGGLVTISLHQTQGNNVILTVADNGKGLPHDFDTSMRTSLGMDMMRGLTSQLKGNFKITTNAGTVIQIEFALMPILSTKSVS